jgi:hypothetical protein
VTLPDRGKMPLTPEQRTPRGAIPDEPRVVREMYREMKAKMYRGPGRGN